TTLTVSVITPTAGIFWLFALPSLALYTYVSGGAFGASILLLALLHLCAIVLCGLDFGLWIQNASHKLVHLLSSILAKADAKIRKVIDLALNLFLSVLNSTYRLKSRPESLDEAILSPGESVSLPQSLDHSDLHAEPSATPSPSPEPRTTRTLPPNTTGAPDLARSGEDTNGANNIPTRPTPSSDAFSNFIDGRDYDRHSTFASGVGHPSRSAVVSSTLLPSFGASRVGGASTGQARLDVCGPFVVALPKGSCKVPKTSLGIDDVDKFRGSIVAASAGGRTASLTLPHVVIHKDLVDASFISHVRTYSLPTLLSSAHSASAPLTPTYTTTRSTPVELQTGLKRGTFNAHLSAPRNVSELQRPKKDGENTTEIATSLLEKETQTRDHRPANSAALLPNPDLSQSKYNSQRVKRQGRYFGKGRRIWSFLVPTAPLSSPAPRAVDGRAVEPDQNGSSQAEVVQETLISRRPIGGPAGLSKASIGDDGPSSNQLPTAFLPSTPTPPPALAGCALQEGEYPDDNGLSQDEL
ncbi:hypothetical protein FRC01_009522, partial [Tulasnella sp. 417]